MSAPPVQLEVIACDAEGCGCVVAAAMAQIWCGHISTGRRMTLIAPETFEEQKARETGADRKFQEDEVICLDCMALVGPSCGDRGHGTVTLDDLIESWCS